METNKKIRYCKNCKCELPSTNNDGLCGNCRDTNNNKTFKTIIIGSLLGIGAAVIKSVMKKSK